MFTIQKHTDYNKKYVLTILKFDVCKYMFEIKHNNELEIYDEALKTNKCVVENRLCVVDNFIINDNDTWYYFHEDNKYDESKFLNKIYNYYSFEYEKIKFLLNKGNTNYQNNMCRRQVVFDYTTIFENNDKFDSWRNDTEDQLFEYEIDHIQNIDSTCIIEDYKKDIVFIRVEKNKSFVVSNKQCVIDYCINTLKLNINLKDIHVLLNNTNMKNIDVDMDISEHRFKFNNIMMVDHIIKLYSLKKDNDSNRIILTGQKKNILMFLNDVIKIDAKDFDYCLDNNLPLGSKTTLSYLFDSTTSVNEYINGIKLKKFEYNSPFEEWINVEQYKDIIADYYYKIMDDPKAVTAFADTCMYSIENNTLLYGKHNTLVECLKEIGMNESNVTFNAMPAFKYDNVFAYKFCSRRYLKFIDLFYIFNIHYMHEDELLVGEVENIIKFLRIYYGYDINETDEQVKQKLNDFIEVQFE